MRGAPTFLIFLGAAAVLAAVTAAAAKASCRLALTLALDVSSSVDESEYFLQMEGLALALEDPEVRDAMFLIPGSHVTLQVFEWSGINDQVIVQDWTAIVDAADLDRMAAHIRAHERRFRHSATALGQALAFARRQLDRAPDCGFRKIDISGDGQSNLGIPPQQLYTLQDFGDVTVNGLAIQSDEASLDRYYRFFVISGPGAFVEVAADFDAYAEAIKRKLIRELGVPQLGRASGPARPPRS